MVILIDFLRWFEHSEFLIIRNEFGLRTLDVWDFTLQACEKFWLFIQYFCKIRFHFFYKKLSTKKGTVKIVSHIENDSFIIWLHFFFMISLSMHFLICWLWIRITIILDSFSNGLCLFNIFKSFFVPFALPDHFYCFGPFGSGVWVIGWGFVGWWLGV